MFSWIARILPGRIYPMPKGISERRDFNVRRIAMRNAEGSVRLGQGKITLQTSVDALYQKLKHADF